MQVLIIYDSAYGNTAKVARVIAKTLQNQNEVIERLTSEAGGSSLKAARVVAVGSPTQGGRPTKAVQKWLSSLSAGALEGKDVAAFDTRLSVKEHGLGLRVVMSTIGFAAPKIGASLVRKGGRLVTEPAGFIVADMKGPLKPGELERASEWARSLVDGRPLETSN